MIDIFNANNMFITGDIHLFHNNICKYCGRPYNFESNEEVLQMNEDILKKFDELPDEVGTVIWNLGDIAYGKLITKNETPFETLKGLVSRMKGEHRLLVLVLGNHDKDLYKFLHKKTKHKNIVKFYMDLGFDYVFTKPFFFNDNIIISHEPFYVKPGSGFTNIHGHVHNSPMTEDYFEVGIENYDMKRVAAEADNMEDIPDREITKTGKKIDLSDYVNVCWDNTNFELLDFKEILKKVK